MRMRTSVRRQYRMTDSRGGWKQERVGGRGKGVRSREEEVHTRPPEIYVPTERVLGPTSNLGREKRKTRRGS